jgi:hypothetical protein
MLSQINDATPSRRQAVLPPRNPRNRAERRKTRHDANNRSGSHKHLYRNTAVSTAVALKSAAAPVAAALGPATVCKHPQKTTSRTSRKGHTSFGQHRSLYGAVKASAKPAPAVAATKPVIAGLLAPWSVTSTPVLLLAATCSTAPAFDRPKAAAPLAEKAKLMAMCQELSNTGTDKPRSPVYPTKDEIMLLKVPASKDCIQPEYVPPVAPPTILTAEPVRFWAGRSDTPGLSDKISTKESANTLAAARKANSPFLTDGARARSGALA